MKTTELKSIIENIIREEFVSEKKKSKKSDDIEFELDAQVKEPSAEEAAAELATEPAATEPAAPVDGDMDMDMSGGDSTEKTIGKGLQTALDAAKQLPDSEMKSKLIRQIGNTALFFLKTQIPTSGEQM
jgi:hypothetical protein